MSSVLPDPLPFALLPLPLESITCGVRMCVPVVTVLLPPMLAWLEGWIWVWLRCKGGRMEPSVMDLLRLLVSEGSSVEQNFEITQSTGKHHPNGLVLN